MTERQTTIAEAQFGHQIKASGILARNSESASMISKLRVSVSVHKYLNDRHTGR